MGLSLGQGIYLGCWFDPQWGSVQEATQLLFLSTSMFLFLSLPSSLCRINKYILSEDFFLERTIRQIEFGISSLLKQVINIRAISILLNAMSSGWNLNIEILWTSQT